VNLIRQCPPLELSEEHSPACPYKEFLAILTEDDAVDAVQDQVLKLGPDFDRSALTGLYRLLWLLNDTTRHKTFQTYLRFKKHGKLENRRAESFFSEIFLCPLQAETGHFIIGIEDITELASEFARRFAIATASLNAGEGYSIRLTPIKTKLDVPMTSGYSLILRAEGIDASAREAVVKWRKLIQSMTAAFEK